MNKVHSFGHRLLIGIFVLLPLILAGCGSGGGAKMGVVEGKVTVEGKAGNSGSVAFTVSGQTVSGTIEPDGTYRAVGVPVGDAQVTVLPAIVPPGMKDMPAPTKDMPGGPKVEKPVPIPAKYGKAESSGLTFPVKKGTNTFNLELTAK